LRHQLGKAFFHNGHFARTHAFYFFYIGIDTHHVVAKVRAAVDGKNAFVLETAAPPAPLPPPLVAHECGLAYEIGVDPAHDFGIYLDAAKARLYVRGVAKGKRVLNLFSYTGAFGIAAAAGGATRRRREPSRR
jgi:23S rRNA G2069 N7-methylase RlmK/C1962 C5-methylase RlmI